jgi:hypothetical protein
MGGPLAPVWPTFRALSETFVPEAAALDAAGWERLAEIAGSGLGTRPIGVQRQVVLLVRLLDALSLLRHGRRLRNLSPERREHLLDSFQHSRLLLLRRGVWGLRTLAFMGYYARSEIHPDIGYRANAEGWGAGR